MKTIEQLNNILDKNKQIFESNQEYRKMAIFLERANRAGIVVKGEYSIPPIDTIGIRYDNPKKEI